MNPFPDTHTELFCIIGHPVHHSLSPLMHNAAFRNMKMNAVYLAFDVQDLRAAMEGIRALGIKGLSVTIPHKEVIIPYLDEVDETVKEIGAVNTVINRDGGLVGANTDWLGAIQAIEDFMDIKGKKVLVLGAGGSAKAVCYGLKVKGAEFHIANRTGEKARRLAEEFGGAWSDLSGLDEIDAHVLINTTSVGMSPNDKVSPFPAHALKKFHVVMDIVYKPLETRLLKDARHADCITIDGLKMLLYQAVFQFQLWTGKKAPVDVMREALTSS